MESVILCAEYPMNCPICDQKLFVTGSLKRECSNHYYANIESYTGLVSWEIFTYGKYKIARQYTGGVITEYSLHFPMIRRFGNCLRYKAEEIDFDPKNPENVLNKLKMITVFS